MRAEVVELCFRDACFIAANIRQQDWDECRCQLDDENKFYLANLCFFGTEPDLRWCVRLDGQPVAAFGALRSGAAQYQLWMWSTDRLLRAFPALVKFMDGEFRQVMHRKGTRRVEVRVMAGHDFDKRGWLVKAGAIEVCPLPQYGKNGEMFRLYAWWKGMPNAKDIQSGYRRVRGAGSYPAVPTWNAHRKLSDDELRSSVGREFVPVHDVSHGGDGQRGSNEAVGGTV